ncbi:hypothetical protein F2Q68_00007087 [Brassica cretica]|uniref:NYN domain-containing protein n=1 Tax=Brassica cretica TaxID=69181 RepID=A0A8S9KSL0_BRACR|nr:hypothetical protein F2Q68_00007087 [Brassica cretica]
MIIAGDGDFGNLLSTSMKKKNVNLMLTYPKKESALLKDEARTTFKWTVERSFDAPELMINGGRGVNNILIIAGDEDFGNLLRTAMKRKNVDIMLAYPEKGSVFLKHEACTTFRWSLERTFDAL